MDTIRNHLNGLSLAILRKLARKHNKLYNIKIGQTKEELIEALATQYETMTGTDLIHRQPDKLDMIIPKPPPRAKKSKAKEPEPKQGRFENMIAPAALKEKLRLHREVREARQNPKSTESDKTRYLRLLREKLDSRPQYDYDF